MTKTEINLLRKCIKDLIKAHRVAWDDLKREIFDNGYQVWYPSQDHFKQHAIKAVFSLSKEAKDKLTKEWKHWPRLIERNTEDEILNQYAKVVIERIVDRARVAQARTKM